MRAVRPLPRLLAPIVSVALVLGPAGAASAGLVSTSDAFVSNALESDALGSNDMRAAGPDVRAALAARIEAFGVPAAEARARVASLSHAEVAQIDAKLSELPAGGDFFSVVGGALLLAVAILFTTDVLGYTDVFPFINSLPPREQKAQ